MSFILLSILGLLLSTLSFLFFRGGQLKERGGICLLLNVSAIFAFYISITSHNTYIGLAGVAIFLTSTYDWPNFFSRISLFAH